MSEVKVREGESLESALKRFKRRLHWRVLCLKSEKRTLRKASVRKKKKAEAARKKRNKK